MAYICRVNRKNSYFCESFNVGLLIIIMIYTRLKGNGGSADYLFKEDESVDYDARRAW